MNFGVLSKSSINFVFIPKFHNCTLINVLKYILLKVRLDDPPLRLELQVWNQWRAQRLKLLRGDKGIADFLNFNLIGGADTTLNPPTARH